MEYHHHGDALVPRQQRFGGYTRSLMKGLGIPVENRCGLRPARGPGDATASRRLTDREGSGHARLARGRHDLQLPHAPAALRGDDRRHAVRPRPGPAADRPVQAASVHGRGQHGVQHARLDAAGRRAGRRRAGGRLHDLQHAVRRRREPGALLEEPRHGRRGRARTADVLELDDIQSGVLRPGPLRTRRPTSCSASTTATRGRELMRRLERRRDLGRRHPTSPLARYLGQRRAHLPRASRRWACRRTSLDSFAWEFRQGMAARAKALGDTGESSPEHWEQPLGTRGRPRRARRARAGPSAARGGARARAQGLRRALPGIERDLAPGLPRAAHRAGSPSGSGTASAIPPSRGAASPAPTRRRRRSRRASSSSATPTRLGGFPPMPQPEVLGRNGTYVVFRKLHQRVAAFRRYLKDERDQPRGGGAAGGQDDGPLAQRRAAGALPAPRRSRSWAPTRGATTTSSIARRPDRLQDAAAARTSGGRIRATRPSPASSGSTG